MDVLERRKGRKNEEKEETNSKFQPNPEIRNILGDEEGVAVDWAFCGFPCIWLTAN